MLQKDEGLGLAAEVAASSSKPAQGSSSRSDSPAPLRPLAKPLGDLPPPSKPGGTTLGSLPPPVKKPVGDGFGLDSELPPPKAAGKLLSVGKDEGFGLGAETSLASKPQPGAFGLNAETSTAGLPKKMGNFPAATSGPDPLVGAPRLRPVPDAVGLAAEMQRMDLAPPRRPDALQDIPKKGVLPPKQLYPMDMDEPTGGPRVASG